MADVFISITNSYRIFSYILLEHYTQMYICVFHFAYIWHMCVCCVGFLCKWILLFLVKWKILMEHKVIINIIKCLKNPFVEFWKVVFYSWLSFYFSSFCRFLLLLFASQSSDWCSSAGFVVRLWRWFCHRFACMCEISLWSSKMDKRQCFQIDTMHNKKN